MIRIRNTKGEAIQLPPDAVAVELCSTDGKVARLILCGGDRVEMLDTQDSDLRKYCKSLGLEVAEVINLIDK
jgi:hypothetical protein